jgi:hypothetical protein
MKDWMEMLSTYVGVLMKELNMDKPTVLDILSCIPEITKLEPKKVTINIKRLRDYLKLSEEDFIKLVVEYPTIIANYKNIERIEFYMHLYFEMTKEEVYNMVMRFPLLLIADVILY